MKVDDETPGADRMEAVPDHADDHDVSASWRVFVTLVTATALFFACFAALYDASIYWGPAPPTLGPKSTPAP